MNNIERFFTSRPVRDRVGAVLLLLAAGTHAAAERMAPEMQQRPNDRDVVWSLQLSPRVVDGDATETFFWYNAAGARTPLSRLDWEMPRVAMLGGTASATSGRLTLHAGSWTAVTEGEAGHVLDYDWTDFGSAKWTSFSDSHADVVSARTFDIGAQWAWVQDFHGLTLKGLLGMRYDDWSWEGYGGYGLYPQYGYKPYLFDPSVIEITYKQDFSFPYAGLAADWQVGNWVFSANLRYSPLVSAESEDFHTYRNIRFNGSFDRGDMIGAGASAAYVFDSGIFLSLSADFQHLEETTGNLSVIEYGSGKVHRFSDSAGIENETLALSLGLGMRF